LSAGGENVGDDVAAPADADKVGLALRLGWAIAEVRGRYRLDAPPVARSDMPPNPANALPLRSERSAGDQRTQVRAVLTTTIAALAQDHNTLDTDPVAGAPAFSAALTARADALGALEDTTTPAATAAWNAFADVVKRFDAHIQDVLTAASEPQACAYLLGRGLAESFWALDPHAPMPPQPGGPATDSTSWAFLLGGNRCAELSRLLGRLSAYFNTYTSPAVSGSLVVWHKVVITSGWWQQPSSHADLYAQTRRWYELLVIGQDPTTLIKPFGMLRNLRTVWAAVRLFLPQLVLGALSIAGLFGFVAVSGTSLGKTFGVTLGAVGLSLTTLTAKAKSSAQALTARLKSDAYSDLVAIAITIVPPRTDSDRDRPRRIPNVLSPTRRSVTAALRDRPITTAVNPQPRGRLCSSRQGA
jgi:hypothetical protein